MLNENKTYTYEELKEIIKKAEKDTVEKLTRDLKETGKNKGKEVDFMAEFIFEMQNMIATHTMANLLLGEVDE